MASLSAAQITLFLPKPLHVELLEAGPSPRGSTACSSSSPGKPSKLVWRIDRDEPASTFVRMRQNLTGASALIM